MFFMINYCSGFQLDILFTKYAFLLCKDFSGRDAVVSLKEKQRSRLEMQTSENV